LIRPFCQTLPFCCPVAPRFGMLEDRKRDEYTSVGVASRERRAHARYPFSAGVETVEVRSGARLHGRISDIGRGGCYVDSISPFTVGAELKVLIIKDANSFAAQARVVYSTAGMGMGVMFTTIEPEQRWMLEKWLAELRGESSAVEQPKNGDVVLPSETPKSATEQTVVLNELIVVLMRKRVLTDAEGKALLQKLLR
jgi:hypothetical protein